MFERMSVMAPPHRARRARYAAALLAAAIPVLAHTATTQAQCTGRFLPTLSPDQIPGMDVGFSDYVLSLVSKDGLLYAGGKFSSADGVPAKAIARWDGITWQPVLGGMHQAAGLGTGVYTMAARPGLLPHSPTSLIVGGRFSHAGGPPGTPTSVAAGNIASFSDGLAFPDWDPLGAGLDGDVRAIITHGGQLYAGGAFITSGGQQVRGLAHWSGSTWLPHSPPGFAAGDVVESLQPFGGRLIAGGFFDHLGFRCIAALAGESTWSPLGNGVNGEVLAMTVFNGELIAAGGFSTAGGVPAPGVARWNGSVWQPIGSFPATTVYAVAVYNNKLYVGGVDNFTGEGVFRVWDGAAWTTPFTGPVNSLVASLTVHNGELILGGKFDMILTAHNWARWSDTGKPWIVNHPASRTVGVTGQVSFAARPVFGYNAFGELTYQWRRNGVPIKDGPGGAVLGGGTVQGASDTLFQGDIAELAILDVRPIDQGSYDCVISTPCGSSISFPATLTVTGTCSVDFNEDGIVDFADYLEFLNLFDARDSRVDFTADGVIDFADYLEFLNHFDAGC